MKKALAPGGAVLWRRWIELRQIELWIARLAEVGETSWTISEKPGVRRGVLRLHPHSGKPSSWGVERWIRQYGGRAEVVDPADWLRQKPGRPIIIARRLRLIEAEPRLTSWRGPQLVIPRGMAFGSGDHATTRMLLEALGAVPDWRRLKLLDLGTGSGILALAARALGASAITALDFDPPAVAIARANEAANFMTPAIRWQAGDVLSWKTRQRFGLVAANLYSEVLIAAAAAIARTLARGGRLLMSGILHTQEAEVVQAYRAARLRLLSRRQKGKWLLLEWQNGADPGEELV